MFNLSNLNTVSRLKRTPFYFLRHGETDYNVHQIYDDIINIPLNANGVNQSLKVHEILASIPICTVCSSPLLRAQQTKNIVMRERQFQDVTIEKLKECDSQLWRLFLASEVRELTLHEQKMVLHFIDQVEQALHEVLKLEDPLLIIAHGGIYWAITHLLQLPGDRKADNCHLLQIYPNSKKQWGVRSMTTEAAVQFHSLTEATLNQSANSSNHLEVSTVFIECENQLLFLRRRLDKISPGTWAVPGGKLEKGETPLEGLLREIWEELQVRPAQEELSFIQTLYVSHPLMKYILHLYKWELSSFPSIIINHQEHQSFLWQPINRIAEIPLLEGQFKAFQYAYKTAHKEYRPQISIFSK